MKRIALLVAAMIAAVSVGAQELRPSSAIPTADGVVNPGEYSMTTDRNGMRLGLSLSADGSTLYAAIEAPTTGWVSVGLGSLKMNGAFMVLAYDNAGEAFVSEETGAGYGHKPNTVKRLSASAVKEAGASTTLEFAVPAAGLADARTVKLILAYGKKDDRSSKHSKYASVELPIKRP